MQRARCCAANAYDATSAFHAVFGRTFRPRLLRRPSKLCNDSHLRNSGAFRSYSTTLENARQKGPDASEADRLEIKDSRARKMAFYEELMAADLLVRSEETPKKSVREQKGPLEEEQAEKPSHTVRPGQSSNSLAPWKTHMAAMSRYIRELKLSQRQGASDEETDPRFFELLDYKKLAVSPEQSNVNPPRPIPWATGATAPEAKPTAAQVLDLEIAAFCNHMMPTTEEHAARSYVRNNIWNIIEAIFKNENENIVPYTFGSNYTRLAMPYSDIDIGVFVPANIGNPLEQPMTKLFNCLKRGNDYMLVVHRGPPNAIITAQHKHTGIDVQIIAKGKPGMQDRVVEAYLRKIPNLRQLYTVVRTAFGIRGFVDPYVGGISAYGTSIMLVAALTRRGTPPQVHESLTAQLLHFLSFWAEFDTTKYGITVPKNQPAKLFKKIQPDMSSSDTSERLKNIKAARRRKDEARAGQYRIGRVVPRQPYLLCLQDPANPINDLGANCHAIKHIQQTCKSMHYQLVNYMAKYDAAELDSELRNGGFSLLLPLVGRSHEVYAERRERMVAKKLKTKRKPMYHKPLVLGKKKSSAGRPYIHSSKSAGGA